MKLMIFSVTKAVNNNPLGANMPNMIVLPLCKICEALFVWWSCGRMNLACILA